MCFALLCARRERPRNYSTAEHCDELTPSHPALPKLHPALPKLRTGSNLAYWKGVGCEVRHSSLSDRLISLLGQSRRLGDVRLTSAFPLIPTT